eukprot:5761658-Prymnesium_polylepis.1
MSLQQRSRSAECSLPCFTRVSRRFVTHTHTTLACMYVERGVLACAPLARRKEGTVPHQDKPARIPWPL